MEALSQKTDVKYTRRGSSSCAGRLHSPPSRSLEDEKRASELKPQVGTSCRASQEMQDAHPLIGDVPRPSVSAIGVELVLDRKTKEPAAEELQHRAARL